MVPLLLFLNIRYKIIGSYDILIRPNVVGKIDGNLQVTTNHNPYSRTCMIANVDALFPICNKRSTEKWINSRLLAQVLGKIVHYNRRRARGIGTPPYLPLCSDSAFVSKIDTNDRHYSYENYVVVSFSPRNRLTDLSWMRQLDRINKQSWTITTIETENVFEVRYEMSEYLIVSHNQFHRTGTMSLWSQKWQWTTIHQNDRSRNGGTRNHNSRFLLWPKALRSPVFHHTYVSFVTTNLVCWFKAA